MPSKGYLTFVAVVSLVVVVVTVAGAWPWWFALLILVPVVIGGLILKYRPEKEPMYQSPLAYQPPLPQAAPPASNPVRGLVLPSAHQDYRFLLNATVLWRPSGVQGVSHPRPVQLGIDAIRERAVTFAKRESAADVDLVAPRLAEDLGTPRTDRTGHLEVWAQDVVLTIPDDDRERLSRLARIRKDEEVWEYERAHERNKRAYLREDVLSSTGSAVVWWLARDTAQVEGTVSLIGTLAKLVAAAHDREVEPVFHTFVNSLTDPSTVIPAAAHQDMTEEDFVDRLMAEFFPDGPEYQRVYVVDRLATLAAEAGATELARALRKRFNALDFTKEAPEPGLFDDQQSELIPGRAGSAPTNGQAESATPPDPPS